jgi:hypothetical protein
MKISRFLSLFIGLTIVGCASLPPARLPSEGKIVQEKTIPKASATEQPKMASLPDLGLAPELENKIWLNTDQTLRLKNLHGKVSDGAPR